MPKPALQTIAMITLLLITASGQGAQERAPTLGDLAWLAGCWEGGQESRRREEFWIKPAGGMMLGLGRAVSNGKMIEFEYMRLHEDRGSIYFTARPSNQPEASFKLATLSRTEAVFENPEHDFPQRISYRQLADGSLLVRIEGEAQGKKRAVDFPFKRMKCE